MTKEVAFQRVVNALRRLTVAEQFDVVRAALVLCAPARRVVQTRLSHARLAGAKRRPNRTTGGDAPTP